MRPGLLLALTMAGCSNASHGSDGAPVYVNPDCGVNFSTGCPGFDAGPCTPGFSCEPLPSECVDNPTCDCIACSDSTCGPKGVDPPCGDASTECVCSGSGGAQCAYQRGTFTVECINP